MTDEEIKIPKPKLAMIVKVIAYLIAGAFMFGGWYKSIDNAYPKTSGLVLEERIKAMQETDELLRQQLNRIEGKIDKISERTR